MSYKLGIDAGGTFTDFVAVDEEGRTALAKTPSTNERPEEAIRAGLDLISKDLRLSPRAFLSGCSLIILGTTVAANALIQEKFARTGLICTKGFRDILEIRQGHKEQRYNWRYRQPKVVVPRYLRLPVEERINADGEIVIPLNKSDVINNIRKFKSEGVECVAVSLLWSFGNPVHENMVREMLREELPEAHVSLSSEILPEIGEYNRTSTTVLNACLTPIVTNYIDHVEACLHSMGYDGAVRYTQANAGIASGDVVKQKVVTVIFSGPSQAPVLGCHVGSLHGYQSVITIDMGGTSFDASLAEGGVIETERSSDIQRYRVAIPTVRINTLGAGGGSMAWIDSGGLLHVGPQSAEADPGPACYDKGGEEPTVTDASVILGYLNPEVLLGGRFAIDRRLAERAVEERIARPLGTTVERASLGIFNLVNSNMINGIREISIERGLDPREFILVAGGGSGPTHAGRLAEGMEIPIVLVPRFASVFCAFGSTLADIKHSYTASYVVRLDALDVDRLDALLEEMEERGYENLAAEGIPRDLAETTTTLYVRYAGQAYDCPVVIGPHRIDKRSVPEIEEAFHQVHKRLYTFDDRKSECELVTAEVTVKSRGAKYKIAVGDDGEKGVGAEARVGERPAFFEEYGEYSNTPVFNGEKIRVGNCIKGPAIIEEATTTIVVFPGWRLELDKNHLYVMTHQKSGDA